MFQSDLLIISSDRIQFGFSKKRIIDSQSLFGKSEKSKLFEFAEAKKIKTYTRISD